MARLLIGALRLTGLHVEVVSSFRSHLATPEPKAFSVLQESARREVGRIAAGWEQAMRRPDLWLTYHNYYKAPDLIGPELTRRFALPFVMAEASHAPKRTGSWSVWHSAAERATRAANLHVCFTERDRAGIAGLLRPETPVVDLPPFIDDEAFAPRSPDRQSDSFRIVTVAMMRPGDKLDSYRFLAAALLELLDEEWQIRLIGDGPARAEVEAAFACLPAHRVAWCGQLDREALERELLVGDLYAWPGFGEAFGLSYLEAQRAGLPVVALHVAGVDSVVRAGQTGLLVESGTPAAYATAIRTLMRDESRRRRMGDAAADWVRRERTVATAAATLHTGLQHVLNPTRRSDVF